MGELDDKITVITGGGSGIGAGIARVMAREGADVVVTDLSLDAARRTAEEVGGLALEHDVRSWNACEDVARRVNDEKGAIDVLVNNAGVSKGIPFHELDEAEWDRVNDVNAKGVFLTTRAIVPQMMERRAGRIISISSMVGREGYPLLAHYCASKFAVIGMTQSLAKELASYDITVNAVCPGVVRTPLWDPLLDDLAQAKDITQEDAFEEFLQGIPLGRPQEPEDVGEVCAFLASSRAGNMTGLAINVSGGQQVH